MPLNKLHIPKTILAWVRLNVGNSPFQISNVPFNGMSTFQQVLFKRQSASKRHLYIVGRQANLAFCGFLPRFLRASQTENGRTKWEVARISKQFSNNIYHMFWDRFRMSQKIYFFLQIKPNENHKLFTQLFIWFYYEKLWRWLQTI